MTKIATPEERMEIVNMLQQGSTGLKGACERVGVSYGQMYDWLRRNGFSELVRRSKGSNSGYKKMGASKILLGEDQKELIENMYCAEKLSLQEIADRLGVHKGTIYKFFKRHGIPVRTRSEGSAVRMERPGVREAFSENQKRRALAGEIGVMRGQTFFNTAPERHFIEWCDRNNIPYTQQYRLVYQGHPYDFHINGTKILVEIDGTFWHSRPEQICKDSIQVQEASQLGYDVVRITDQQQRNPDCYEGLYKMITRHKDGFTKTI